MKRQEHLEKEFEVAYNNAVVVKNNIDLKTAIGKKELVIISEDAALYERLLKKVPKENVAAGAKNTGRILAVLGVAISVLSAGLFSFVGIPMAIAGGALGAAGLVLDDYKDYSLYLDYDKKAVIFFKVKGSPKLNLPASPQKLIR